MKTTLLGTLLFGALLALASCSGGTGGTGATGSSPGVSIGVMTKGSVIVNGVRFQDTTATIRIDDRIGTSAELQSGMVVKVRGQINDDSVNGVAQQIEVENEVRGKVQTHDAVAVPHSFTLIGQTVFVDDLTVFANFTSSTIAAVGELVDGTSVVEVHGLRDSAGNIHASRVELLNAQTAAQLGDELRGIVKPLSLTPTAFTLKNGNAEVSVSYMSNMISPAGATLTEAALVEVHGAFSGATFVATRVDIEDLEDVQFQHGAGEEFDIEGQVSGCGNASPCTSFLVGSQAVQTNASTRFENGSAADLADNARVEAEGHQFSGTMLIAEKIEFKRARVILTGVATVTGTIPGNGTLVVLGKSVQITSLTEIRQNAGITSGERVEVRGFVDSAGTVVAERVDDNPSGGNKDIVQARVTAENGNILTLLAINADLSVANQFFDANELPITRDAFLAAVTPAPAPGGTLVKVKGTFNSGTNTIAVEEAELEN
jgi:hypothetical protein